LFNTATIKANSALQKSYKTDNTKISIVTKNWAIRTGFVDLYELKLKNLVKIFFYKKFNK
jgi:hypothetical protein